MLSIKDPVLSPYYIDKDPLNYIVGKEAIAEESGNSYKQVISFHSSVQSALKFISKHLVEERTKDEYTSVKDYINDSTILLNELQEKMKNYV